MAPVNSQNGPLIASPSSFQINQREPVDGGTKAGNASTAIVPFVGNGLNMVSLAEKVGSQVPQKGGPQQLSQNHNINIMSVK